ncbi:MAG TPA: sigma-70 family RNA polymerase sigma factor [Pirellulales bacterium]|nr:sigma-70 family RNA polymerase sigma factor [Pirellulales bacterium]
MAHTRLSAATGSTDSSLLRKARQHQSGAWKQLVELYGPLVYSWGRRANLQAADAADIVQEVFAAAAGGLDHFEKRPDGGFRAWLRSITGHKISDQLRRRQRAPQGAGGSSAAAHFQQVPSPDELVPDEPPRVRERTRIVYAALEELRGEIEERTWQAFWRTTIEGHSPAEVAAALGMKTGAIYQAKSRTLIRLREIVATIEESNE